MSPREHRMIAENAAWAVQNLPGVSLALVGNLIVAFTRDTSIGRSADPPCDLAPVRQKAIAAARGLSHPFAWWLH